MRGLSSRDASTSLITAMGGIASFTSLQSCLSPVPFGSDHKCNNYTVFNSIPASAPETAHQFLSHYSFFMKLCGVYVIAETQDEYQNMLKVAKTFTGYMDADGNGDIDS